MRVDRRTLLYVALVLALYLGWSAYRSSTAEIAVLRTIDSHGADTFTSVWVVDGEDGLLWIRANRPDRRWLAALEEHPEVELRRRGRSHDYLAQVFDDPRTRAYLAPYFREKYGLADVARRLVNGNDVVPVRLEIR